MNVDVDMYSLYPLDVHYSPQGAAQTVAGQAMLENYLQGVDSQTTIMGDLQFHSN